MSRRVETALHLLHGGFRLQRWGRFEVGWQVRTGHRIARLRNNVCLCGAEGGEQLALLFLRHFELIERLHEIVH